MEIGVSTACTYAKLHIEDAVREYGRLGIQTTEVFLNTFSEHDPAFIQNLKKIADESGVQIVSVHGHGLAYEPNLFSGYDRSKKDSFAIFKRVMEAAEILGADCYVFHGPAILKRARELVLNFDKIGAVVDEAAEVARQHHIKFAYENVHWCFFHYPDFAQELKRKAHSDNLYFVLDLKQAVQSGYDPMLYIDAMGVDRIVNIHLCDVIKKGSYVTPVMPFEGEMDFPALAERLKKEKYDAHMILEVYSDNYGEMKELLQTTQKLRNLFV